MCVSEFDFQKMVPLGWGAYTMPGLAQLRSLSYCPRTMNERRVNRAYFESLRGSFRLPPAAVRLLGLILILLLLPARRRALT